MRTTAGAQARRPGRRLRVRRDDDRECRQPPNGNAIRSRRLRVLAENRPALPVTLAARFDRFNVRGPNLNRLRHPQLMSGVSTTRLGPQRWRPWARSKVADHNFFQSRNAAGSIGGERRQLLGCGPDLLRGPHRPSRIGLFIGFLRRSAGFSRRRWPMWPEGASRRRKVAPVTSEIRDGSHRRKYVKLQVLPMRRPSSMPDFPTEVGRMPYLAAWRHPGPASLCEYRALITLDMAIR